jgi:hypothetical protein
VCLGYRLKPIQVNSSPSLFHSTDIPICYSVDSLFRIREKKKKKKLYALHMPQEVSVRNF